MLRWTTSYLARRGPATADFARLVGWCGEFVHELRRADVRGKLAATGAPERHVLVVVSWATEWAVLHALSRDARGMVPAISPPLPAEVIHLWLLGTGPADRLIAWLSDRGWIDYEFGPCCRMHYEMSGALVSGAERRRASIAVASSTRPATSAIVGGIGGARAGRKPAKPDSGAGTWAGRRRINQAVRTRWSANATAE